MPVDIQPLSAQRRAAMLLVLLLLFGASLAAAQWLVNRRTLQSGHYTVIFAPPPGLTEPVEEYEELEGAVHSGQGRLGGHVRQFVAFSYDSPTPPTAPAMRHEALALFADVLGAQVPVKESPAVLGGVAAINLEAEIGSPEGPPQQRSEDPVGGGAGQARFMVERLALLPGHVVAICYSGPGPYTDADRAIFEQFCTRGTVIRPVDSGK